MCGLKNTYFAVSANFASSYNPCQQRVCLPRNCGCDPDDVAYWSGEAWACGVDKTLLWFCEEVGELVRAVRRGERDRANLEEEFGDVYAWLATLASLHGLDLEAIGRKKYRQGCPRSRAAARTGSAMGGVPRCAREVTVVEVRQ